MKKLFFMFSVFALVSCGTVGKVARSDSSRVEVRTVTEFVPDTVFVELPVIVERVQTLDTASVLENRFARSEASVSGGVLSHSLETKPVKEPVEVESKVIYRDSLLYVDRFVTETVEVARPLSGWQRVRMGLGSSFVVLIAAAILYFIIKFSKSLKFKTL